MFSFFFGELFSRLAVAIVGLILTLLGFGCVASGSITGGNVNATYQPGFEGAITYHLKFNVHPSPLIEIENAKMERFGFATEKESGAN